MNTITGQQLIGQLNWRYATKQFDPQRKISAADWQTLENALQLSPSSAGLQPWKFIVVDDPAVRSKLQGASFGQAQIVDASHMVVFTSRTDMTEADVDRLIDKTAKVRGVSAESLAQFRGMLMGGIINSKPDAASRAAWAARQTYIAVGVLLTSAALLGIDACPMEGFVPPQYDEILGLNGSGYASHTVVTLGYRSATDGYASAPKVRFERDEVIKHV
ncbi:MAG TPA: NAD(P)H-dependent oxidoreductase [Chthoniobacteraceae bacterium]|nr:NAD(P)H-dependent oxidoreductase [Chthoniobacteraceae bacterium]